jgi:sulfotransferase family protein
VSPAEEPRRPVFVGGSSRSGTHAVAHMLGTSSLFHMIPRELGFHAVPAGLVGYVRERFDRDDLIERLRRRWWRVVPGAVGFEGVVTREQLDAALAEFAAAPADRVAAGRELVRTLLDPVAAAAGKPSWVEKSTSTAVAAPVLGAMFPDAGIVHVVRDGRDVASSIARMPWGPDTVPEALEYWADRLRRAESGAREVAPGRILVLHLEDLVLLDREGSYRRLLEYLRMEDERAMRAFFDAEVTAERAHLGRWRADLDEQGRERLTLAYRDVLRRLREEGVTCAPPERALEVSYAGDDEDANPLDPWWEASVER